MKLKQLSAAVIATSAIVSGAHAGAPTVYGKVNASLQSIKEDVFGKNDQSNYELLSNASRIGVKGSMDINDGLKAIYKLEYELYVDGGNSNTFGQRNTYAGLQGTYGTLVFGNNDTPTKMSQGDVDRFNDLTYGDIKNVMAGENREHNIIMYSAPKLADSVDITVAFMPGEQKGYTAPGVKASKQDHGIADHISAAVTYNTDMLYLALASDRNVENTDVVRLVGEYKGGNFKVGAILQNAKKHDKGDSVKTGGWAANSYFTSVITSDIDKQDAYIVNGEFSVTNSIVLKAQYGHAKNEYVVSSTPDTKVDLYAVGADYKLAKGAKLFAYYAANDAKNKAVNKSSTDKTFALGYELKF